MKHYIDNTTFKEAISKNSCFKNISTIYNVDNDFPIELIKEITSWEVLHKSPYGKSYYNTTDLNWGYKPDKSLRISDHWNFQTFSHKTKKHCQTTEPCPDNTHWSIGIYNSELKKYIILASYEKRKRTSKENVLFKLFTIPLKVNKDLHNVEKHNIDESKLEYIKNSIINRMEIKFNELKQIINVK